MAMNSFHVGMADLVVASAPAKLITLGLGSCIGLVIFDTTAKIAGMVHIMLPDSRGAKSLEKVGKFADTAVPALLDEMIKKGAYDSQVKVFMDEDRGVITVSFIAMLMDGTRDGARPALYLVETTDMLSRMGIPLVASDTGGNKGRTVEFSTDTWILTIKTLGKGTSEI